MRLDAGIHEQIGAVVPEAPLLERSDRSAVAGGGIDIDGSAGRLSVQRLVEQERALNGPNCTAWPQG